MEKHKENERMDTTMNKSAYSMLDQQSSGDDGTFTSNAFNKHIGECNMNIANFSRNTNDRLYRKDGSEVSENIIQSDDLEKHKDTKRKNYNRKYSRQRHYKHRDRRKNSHYKHKSSRNRDSDTKMSKRRRIDSSSSDSSYEWRRRQLKRNKRKHSYSSSSSSVGKNYSNKYRRRHKKSKCSSYDSSISSSSSEERRKFKNNKQAEGLIFDKSSHPYFSNVARNKREMLANKRKERFWDGFQWVSKESLDLALKDPSLAMNRFNTKAENKEEKIATGKDLKRVVAINLPLEYGLDQADLCNYLIEKWRLKGDKIVIKSIFLNTEQNSGVIECTEKEMTDMLTKLDGESLFGHTLRFTKVADENGFIHGGDSENLLQDSALLTAQATAIVNSRIKLMQGKLNGFQVSKSIENINEFISFITKSTNHALMKPTKMIKISNLFDRYSEMTPSQFEELYEDIEAKIWWCWSFKRLKIIRNGEEKLGGKFNFMLTIL